MKEAPVRDKKLFKDKEWYSSWTIWMGEWAARIAPVMILVGGWGQLSKIFYPTAWRVITPVSLVGLMGLEYYDMKIQ